MQRGHGGFTIIETMLFLAVTGLVMSIVLAGVTVGINRERYKDAVNSYLDFWQGQYSSVINVSNNRDKFRACGESGIVTVPTPSPLDDRGTSQNCTIVGRVIHSSIDGRTVTSSVVYTTVDAKDLPVNPTDTDNQVLVSAGLIPDPIPEVFDMGWGTGVADSAGAIDRFSVLIVRMPTTGVIHTYVQDDIGKTPREIASAGTTADLTMCVDAGGRVATQRLGVRVSTDAVNSSGVLFASEGAC